jgi:hypothetical protein
LTLKELETVRAAQKLFGALILAGGVPGQGVVVEGVKGVKYAPMPPEMYENSEKTGGFPHFLVHKSPKCRFLLKST